MDECGKSRNACQLTGEKIQTQETRVNQIHQGAGKQNGWGSKAKDENEIRNARKQKSEVGKENMINILK